MPERLANILDRLGNRVAPALRSCSLLALWPQVVDERVRQHAEPLKISNRTLYVATSSPAWAQELGFLKPRIIEKFNRLAGSDAISDIRFKAAS